MFDVSAMMNEAMLLTERINNECTLSETPSSRQDFVASLATNDCIKDLPIIN
jgi:hypothetical protein